MIATVISHMKIFVRRMLVLFVGVSDRTSLSRRVASGDQRVDHALGGGFLRGRLSELYGPMLSGKSALALRAIAGNQHENSYSVWVDGFGSLEADYARSRGVDLKRLAVLCPRSALQAFEMTCSLIDQLACELVVFDEVQRLLVHDFFRLDVSTRTALARLARLAWQKQTTVLFLSSYVDEAPSLRHRGVLRPWFDTGYLCEAIELGAGVRVFRRSTHA